MPTTDTIKGIPLTVYPAAIATTFITVIIAITIWWPVLVHCNFYIFHHVILTYTAFHASPKKVSPLEQPKGDVG
jgi:hypothetical protein